MYFSLSSGFPVWLHNMPGIRMRTDNDVFKVKKIFIYLILYHFFHHINSICYYLLFNYLIYLN
jgi:hypothetical protein